MRVAVTRSGGFAGITRHARLDSADHPVVARLIGEIDLPDAGAAPSEGGRRPGETSPARGADRFVYDIEIGDRAVRVGEADLTEPLRRLVEHVLAHGH